VGWLGTLWSVGPEGVTEWALRLAELSPPHVSEVRVHWPGMSSGQDAAAATLGVSAQASLPEIKRAYRRAAKQAHPDLHPGDADAPARFRGLQEAYEALTGAGAGGGAGLRAGTIRFFFPSPATVSFLAAREDEWLVGGSEGTLFRLSSGGKLRARVRVGQGALFPLRDRSGQIVALSSYPLAGSSQPNLWFVDADAPVSLPDRYRWPDYLRGSYGSFVLSMRPRTRDLALIDECGRLAVELCCPRAITSIAVAEGALVLAAGALICLEVDGLAPLIRTRVWRPPFAGAGFHEPTSSPLPATG
jgi:DnaJ-like protein